MFEEFKQEYLGNWVAQCAVQNNKGEHCPDNPEHYIDFNGKTVGLCKRCYLNYVNGAFDKDHVKKMHREDRLYIKGN